MAMRQLLVPLLAVALLALGCAADKGTFEPLSDRELQEIIDSDPLKDHGMELLEPEPVSKGLRSAAHEDLPRGYEHTPRPRRSSEFRFAETESKSKAKAKTHSKAKSKARAEAHALATAKAKVMSQAKAHSKAQLGAAAKRAEAERAEAQQEAQLGMMTEEEMRRRGIGSFLKKVGGAVVKGAKAVVKGAVAVGQMVGALPTQSKQQAADVEDCVACRYIWLKVEQQVGGSQMEEDLYDAFTDACIKAQRAPIFYPACENMFDDVYGMIGDYMDGYTVNQMCEGAKMCR